MTLSVDAHGTGNGQSTTSGSVAITTSNANDILVLAVYHIVHSNSTAAKINSVTTSGLTWNKRIRFVNNPNGGNGSAVEEWWAYAASAGSYTASITFSATIDSWSGNMLAITGANTSAPFDTSPVLPGYGQTTGGYIAGAPITTLSANCMLLAFAGNQGEVGGSSFIGTGWTYVVDVTNGGGALSSVMSSAYNIVSSTQNNFASMGTSTVSSGNVNGFITDAIVAASQTPLAGLANTTIDGIANAGAGSGTSVSCYLTTTNPGGGYIVACLGAHGQSTAPSVSTMVDSAGNTYTKYTTKTRGSDDLEVWYTQISAPVTSLELTVTFTGGGGGGITSMEISAFGVANTIGFDGDSPFTASSGSTGDAAISGINSSATHGALCLFGYQSTAGSAGPQWSSYNPTMAPYNGGAPAGMGISFDTFSSALSSLNAGNSSASFGNNTVIAFALARTANPIALDGSATGTATGTNAVSCTLTTANAGDLIVVCVENDGFFNYATGNSTISGTGITGWTQRGAYPFGGNPGGKGWCEVWYGYASAALTAVTITATLSASSETLAIMAFGVANADLTTNNDTNAALPAFTGWTTTTNNNTSFSTSNPNDLIINIMFSSSGSAMTTFPAGYVEIAETTQAGSNYSLTIGGSYLTPGAAQNNTLSLNTNPGGSVGALGSCTFIDAFRQAGSPASAKSPPALDTSFGWFPCGATSVGTIYSSSGTGYGVTLSGIGSISGKTQDTANECIAVLIGHETGTTTPAQVTSVALSGAFSGLTFSRQAIYTNPNTAAGGMVVELWTAPTSSRLSPSGVTLTVNWNISVNNAEMMIFAVRGLYNNAIPLDQGAFPASADSVSNVVPPAVTWSTSAGNSLSLGITYDNNNQSPSGPASGWVAMATTFTGGLVTHGTLYGWTSFQSNIAQVTNSTYQDSSASTETSWYEMVMSFASEATVISGTWTDAETTDLMAMKGYTVLGLLLARYRYAPPAASNFTSKLGTNSVNPTCTDTTNRGLQVNYGINATSSAGLRSVTKPISTLPGNCWAGNNVSNITLSNSNLTATGSGSVGGVTGLNGQTTGKFYCEYLITNNSGTDTAVGCALSTVTLANIGGSTAGAFVLPCNSPNGSIWLNTTEENSGIGTVSNGTIVCMAIDLTNMSGWFRIGNGNWNGSGSANPATNTGGISLSAVFGGHTIVPAMGSNNASAVVTANFGTSAFTYTEPSGFTGWPGYGNQTITMRLEMPDWGYNYTQTGVGFTDGTKYILFYQYYGQTPQIGLQTWTSNSGGNSTLWSSGGFFGPGMEWFQMKIVGGSPQTFSFSSNGQDWIEIYNTAITSISGAFTPTTVGFLMMVQHNAGTQVVSGTNEFYENCLYYSDPDIVPGF